jgi:hypothetical protein
VLETKGWKDTFPWWEILLVAGLLAAGLALRLDHIRNPIIDHITFRQGTEAMMARNFHRNATSIQYPQIMGLSRNAEVWVNEFPLYPYTIAKLYSLFGEDIRIGRVVSIVFSLATGLCCYLLLKTSFTNTAPLFALFFFLASPLGTYLGRTVIRHPMALFFQILALLLWVLWCKSPKWWLLVGTGVSLAITVLMNFANAYIGVPMVLALLVYRGPKGLADKRIWLLAFLALLPSVLWLMHALEFGAAFLAPSDGAVKQRDLGRFLRLEWVNPSFFQYFWQGTWELLLTPAGFLFTVLGLLVFWKNKLAWVARAYLGIALLYLCVDHYVIYINPHDYYYLHLLIPATLCAGLAAGATIEWAQRVAPAQKTVIAVGLAIPLVLATAVSFRAYYLPLREQWLVVEPGYSGHWIKAGEKIREITEPGSLIVLDRAEHALMYLCDRPGWVNDPQKLTEEAMESLVANGADYLLLTLFQMEGDRFTGYAFDMPDHPLYSPGSTWVRENFPVVHEGSIFQIVDLQPEKHGRERPNPAQEESQDG